MKRSEMLEAIIHYVKYTSHLDMSVHGDSNYEQLAKELLQLIENKGMLPPPKRIDPATSFLMYCYYDKVEEKYNFFEDDGGWILDKDNSQLWEPEDED